MMIGGTPHPPTPTAAHVVLVGCIRKTGDSYLDFPWKTGDCVSLKTLPECCRYP